MPALHDALRDTQVAYDESLARGDTLRSLTETANRVGVEKEAEKARKKAEKEGRRDCDSAEFACSVASLHRFPCHQLPGQRGLRHLALADCLLGPRDYTSQPPLE